MVLDIVTYPAKSLRERATEIDEFDDNLKALIENMADTLYEAKGYGLAAPQVGESVRVIIADENAGMKGRDFIALINPVIELSEGEIIGEEGCLSIPGEYATVKRSSRVIVKAFNVNGEEVTIDANDQLARILQHEIDHLNGTLFIDRLPGFKRDTIKKHIKKRIQSGDYEVVEK